MFWKFSECFYMCSNYYIDSNFKNARVPRQLDRIVALLNTGVINDHGHHQFMASSIDDFPIRIPGKL